MSGEPSRAIDRVGKYPLLSALIERRTRRFAKGARLTGGLDYESEQAATPLDPDEEALLAFAACGITGPTIADLPYAPVLGPSSTGQDQRNIVKPGGGNILANLFGRTVASGDALHPVSVFLLNDEGSYMLKRPQDFSDTELHELAAMVRQGEYLVPFRRCKEETSHRRVTVPRELPYLPPFNHWSANREGSSYFLMSTEFTALYINLLLAAFSEDFGLYVVDDRNHFLSAGIRKHSASKGGHLQDRKIGTHVLTVGFFESQLSTITAIEEGGIHQSLALMAQAIGVGGFTHANTHPLMLENLGFDVENVSVSQVHAMSGILKLGMTLLRQPDSPIPTPVCLRRPGARDHRPSPEEDEGNWLIKPFCPPAYKNMEEAVLAFIRFKFNQSNGKLTNIGNTGLFRDPAELQKKIPAYSDRAIAATIDYCDYIYRRYGRFPALTGPFDNLFAYQAHRLDTDFYKEHYVPDVASAIEFPKKHESPKF